MHSIQVRESSAAGSDPGSDLPGSDLQRVDLQRVDLPRFDLRALYGNLLRIAEEDSPREVFQLALLKQAIAVSNAHAGIWFVWDGSGALALGPRLFSDALTASSRPIIDDVADSARKVAAEGLATRVTLEGEPAYTAVLTPVRSQGRFPEVLGLLILRGSQAIEPFLALVQMIAGFANVRDALARGREASWEAVQSAQLIELVARTSEIEDVEQARTALVNGMQELLGCTRVALASADHASGVWRVHHVSGLSDFDRRSALARSIKEVLDETLAGGDLVRWPDEGAAHERQSAGHQRLLSATGSALILSVPLVSWSGNVTGGLVCWWSTPPADIPRLARLLQASVMPAGALAELLDRGAGRGWLGGSARHPARRRMRGAAIAVIAVAGLLAASLMPVTHRVSGRVVLEPSVSRVVAAPFDGVLAGSTVRPGDLVSREAVLASLDGREMRLQLAAVDAEIHAAAKRRDVSMAEGDTHAAQIAALEMRRLELRRSLLEERLANLEIRSPVDGIVVSGDLHRKEGGPLSRGQVLYEVAPLDRMFAEVAIPAEDISYVTTGMPLGLTVDGLPGRRWEVALGPVRPRAEVRNGDNVFVSEVEIDNRDRLLRPGMQGAGRISAGRRSLGWVLFHDPWEHLSRWLGMGGHATMNGQGS